MCQDGYGKVRSVIDCRRMMYWVSMLYNGQRILIFTDDRVLAATVFKVQTVLSTWFGEIYVVFVFYYVPKDVMEWSLSVCLSVCLSVFLSVCLLSTVHSNY